MAARLMFTLDPITGNLIAITDPLAERPLSSLSDIAIPAVPSDRYVLTFIQASGKWEARPMIEAAFNKILTGSVVSIPPQVTMKIYEYTVPADKEGTLMTSTCYADGLGELSIHVNNVEVGTVKNSYIAQDMQFSGRVTLAPGDSIECFVKNSSIEGATNSYTMWLYLREEPI